MISNAEKKILKDSVDLMWECYQEIARTPQNDHWSKICMRAKDAHQGILAEDKDEAENPYLLKGEELARTEAQEKRGERR